MARGGPTLDLPALTVREICQGVMEGKALKETSRGRELPAEPARRPPHHVHIWNGTSQGDDCEYKINSRPS